MRDPGVLASDADRERMVAHLQRQVGAGRLTLDEFSDRSAAAYSARSLGELEALVRDLPTVDAEPVQASRLTPLSMPMLGLALLAAVALFAIVGLASAGMVGPMMAQLGAMCG